MSALLPNIRLGPAAAPLAGEGKALRNGRLAAERRRGVHSPRIFRHARPMIDKARRHRWFCSLTLASLIVATSGCSEELGPERMDVARVMGFVTNGRIRVRAGWIEFIPAQTELSVSLARPRTTKTVRSNAPDVAVGTDSIRLANVSLRSVDAERLFGA